MLWAAASGLSATLACRKVLWVCQTVWRGEVQSGGQSSCGAPGGWSCSQEVPAVGRVSYTYYMYIERCMHASLDTVPCLCFVGYIQCGACGCVFCWVHTVWCVQLTLGLCVCAQLFACGVRPSEHGSCAVVDTSVYITGTGMQAPMYVCAHMHDCSYRPMQCMSSASHWSGPTAAVLRFWITVLTDALPLLHAPDQVHCAVLYGVWLCVKCSSRLSGWCSSHRR